MNSLTVACVLRSGGIYDASWVDRLRRGVARNLDIPHAFVCLSDVKVDCDRIPLETEWPRWWSKIELFRPDLFRGTVLYFDLDTIITGSLNRIASYPHHFTMAHEYYRPHQRCSTAMAWNADADFSFLYEEFKASPTAYQRKFTMFSAIGDQAFIEERFRKREIYIDTFRDLFGEKTIASYKVHKCQAAPPPEAAAVAFHGKPKPHEIADGWVKDTWQ